MIGVVSRRNGRTATSVGPRARARRAQRLERRAEHAGQAVGLGQRVDVVCSVGGSSWSVARMLAS